MGFVTRLIPEKGRPEALKTDINYFCRYRLKLSTVELGRHFGCSGRTIEGYEQGRIIPVAALNVLSVLIDQFNQSNS
jgi:DNA-binding transcriptional regulator YiaG